MLSWNIHVHMPLREVILNSGIYWILKKTLRHVLPFNFYFSRARWAVMIIAALSLGEKLVFKVLFNCVTQLKLYTFDKLSSSIFCCLSVSEISGIGVTRPNLHFFQYVQAYEPFADPVPHYTKQYQLILTKYQPVPSYTDPVSSSTTYNSLSLKDTVQSTE